MNISLARQLARALAVEVIVMDLADMMVSVGEGRPRAEDALDRRDQPASEVESRMSQALIALELLGYRIVPPESPSTASPSPE